MINLIQHINLFFCLQMDCRKRCKIFCKQIWQIWTYLLSFIRDCATVPVGGNIWTVFYDRCRIIYMRIWPWHWSQVRRRSIGGKSEAFHSDRPHDYPLESRPDERSEMEQCPHSEISELFVVPELSIGVEWKHTFLLEGL